MSARVAGASLLFLLVGCASAPVLEYERLPAPRRAKSIDEFMRLFTPEGLSGIAHIAGNRYYCVDDRDGLLHELEIVLKEDGRVASSKLIRSVRLEGRVDLEDCAVDPLDGRVWATDESDHSVRPFDPATGRELTGRVEIPDVFTQHMVPNRSFEALALAPDGLRLYVANEDTLRCDGPVASGAKGGTVRIQEFVRSGKDAPWTPTRQFFYKTERIEGRPFMGLEISGVVALAVTDEGTLLVLERELSWKKPLVPSFLARLYEVSLNPSAGVLWKRLVWQADTSFANYEGLCFGPVLKDGRQTLLLVSDGGGKAARLLRVLSLSAPDSRPASLNHRGRAPE
ncbi:MAG: esterase-like activity of phytase family protein [Kiritimatiellia bacterium]